MTVGHEVIVHSLHVHGDHTRLVKSSHIPYFPKNGLTSSSGKEKDIIANAQNA